MNFRCDRMLKLYFTRTPMTEHHFELVGQNGSISVDLRLPCYLPHSESPTFSLDHFTGSVLLAFRACYPGTKFSGRNALINDLLNNKREYSACYNVPPIDTGIRTMTSKGSRSRFTMDIRLDICWFSIDIHENIHDSTNNWSRLSNLTRICFRISV